MNKWNIFGVLNNLSVSDPIEWNGVALVPTNDTRLKPIVEAAPALAHYLTAFRDQSQRKVSVSTILVDDSVIRKDLVVEAVVAFRNALAASSIVAGSSDAIVSKATNPRVLYSTTFDIYPVTPSRSPDLLTTFTPALSAIDDTIEFAGQTTPGIWTIHLTSADISQRLFAPMRMLWEACYVQIRRRDQARGRKLFRSLEMAFHAAQVPMENQGTRYDYGTSLALWVSACEILAHPGPAGKVDLGEVIQLLDAAGSTSAEVSRKAYTIEWRKKKYKVSLPSKLYSELYAARNDFVHGNPMRRSRPTISRINGKVRSLPLAAPLVFGKLLDVYLSGEGKHSVDPDDFLDWSGLRSLDAALALYRRRERSKGK